MVMGSSSSIPEAQKKAGIESEADSSVARNYNAYLSFHGPNLPREFLNHLHDHFASKGVTFFKDQGIERGETIGPEFVKAIRESQVSIVVVSWDYPSSRWCLDELVEIFKCKAASRQMIVMPIFYRTGPSFFSILRQELLEGFQKACEGETEEVKKRWINALRHIGSLYGEISQDWDDEGAMVEKIATDVSRELNDKFKENDEGAMVEKIATDASLRLNDKFKENSETWSSSSEVDYYESGSCSSEEDYYESGGNNHTNRDGDEDNEAEGFKLSQDENIKTSKHTGFRSWLWKLGFKRRR